MYDGEKKLHKKKGSSAIGGFNVQRTGIIAVINTVYVVHYGFAPPTQP